MKKVLIFVLSILLFSNILFVSNVSALHPIGVAGYITDNSGNFLAGATVTITNDDTGATVTTTTDLDGLYVCGIVAVDDDILLLSAVYDNATGINSVVVDTSILTHWLNASISTGDLKADFIYTPNQPYTGDIVTFRDYSSGLPEQWLWNFGDGGTSVGRHQTHIYETAGTYNVCLEVRKGLETDRACKTITISDDTGTVIPPLQPPLNPDGYTVQECYQILDADKLSKNNAEITIVIMDSGVYPHVYNNTDLSKVTLMHHPSFENGYDFYGHGTFVTYEIAHIVYQKMSNIKIISYRIFDDNGITTSDIFVESVDAIKKLNPDIVSISAGAFGTPDDVFSKKVSELQQMGVLVVASAGNYGPTPSTVISPACSPNVLAVGASDPMFTVDTFYDDMVCIWSSRGPVNGVPVKPNIVAPGESIIGPWRQIEKVISGTSLSTPLIAGASSVVLGEHKGLADIVSIFYFWNPSIVSDTLMNAVEESCVMGSDINSWGHGIPQFKEASNIFFWKLIILLIIMIIIFITIIVIIIVVYRHYRKKWK